MCKVDVEVCVKCELVKIELCFELVLEKSDCVKCEI